MTDSPKLADSATSPSPRHKILARLKVAALFSTLIVWVSAPVVAYAFSDGES
jgi:hypothetical protein